jgi:hypothetical protein
MYIYTYTYTHAHAHTHTYNTSPTQEEIASRRKEISGLMKKAGGLPSAALRSQMEDLIVKRERELRKVGKRLSFQAGVNTNLNHVHYHQPKPCVPGSRKTAILPSRCQH